MWQVSRGKRHNDWQSQSHKNQEQRTQVRSQSGVEFESRSDGPEDLSLVEDAHENGWRRQEEEDDKEQEVDEDATQPHHP